MNAFLRQVSAESAKILSTKTWWLLAIVLAGYTAFMAAFIAFFLGELGRQMVGAGAAALPELQQAQIVYATTTSIGYVFPVLIGALAVTGEAVVKLP